MRWPVDALSFAASLLAWPISRRVVRPLGDEAHRPLPGDELLPDATVQWTHGITLHARPEEVWRWIAQLGCNRGGWYSYDGLDNGGAMSAWRIVPDLQEIAVGDVLPWTPANADGFIVEALEPGRMLALGGLPRPFEATFAYVLEPGSGDVTRLIVRARAAPPNSAAALLVRLVVRPVAFAMQRKQFLNIRRRIARSGTQPA